MNTYRVYFKVNEASKYNEPYWIEIIADSFQQVKYEGVPAIRFYKGDEILGIYLLSEITGCHRKAK